MSRLFTDEELDYMGQSTYEHLQQAIAAGKMKEALSLAKKYKNESTAMHDMYRDWLTYSLDHVAKNQGKEAFTEAMTAGVKSTWLPIREKLSHENLKKSVRMYIAGLRGHHQPLKIEEDEEKIIIHLKPCGSGGRLIKEGKYEGKNALSQIEGPQPATWKKDRLPLYCTHDPIMEIVDIESNGTPFVVINPSKELGKTPCTMFIYKNPDQIPESYYQRIDQIKSTYPREYHG